MLCYAELIRKWCK